MYFAQLVHNEWMKVNNKRQSWIFYIFLLTIIISTAFIMRFTGGNFATAISFLDFAYNMNMGLNLFVVIYALSIGAQIITDEYKDGTIKQLLIRPASRTQILLSKYVAVIIVLLLAYAVIVFSSLLIGGLLFGIHTESGITGSVIIKQIIYNLPELLFIMTLSFFTAVVFKSLALAISIAIVANLTGQLMVALAAKYSWAKWIIFANTQLSIYDKNPIINSGGKPPFPGMTLGFSLTVIVIYIVGLWIIANWIFVKRDVQ